jgi:hypothetical protein
MTSSKVASAAVTSSKVATATVATTMTTTAANRRLCQRQKR